MYYASSQDADNCSGSGSGDETSLVASLDQCVNASPGTYYFTYLYKSSGSGTGYGYCYVNANPTTCPTNVSDSMTGHWDLTTTSAGVWERASMMTLVAPTGTKSLHVFCVPMVGFGFYDQIYLGTSSSTSF